MKRFLPYLVNLILAGLLLVLLTAQTPALLLEPVAAGFERPIGLAHAPDGSGRLFVLEKAGRVRIVDEQGQVLSRPFLDLTERVSTRGERGLLGLAFDPAFPRNGYIYVNFTNTVDQTIVARYQVSAADPNRVDPHSAVLLLRIKQPTGNHNAGHMAFGPDGYLYISTGDGGGSASSANSQDLTTLLGALLRIDVRAEPTGSDRPYALPPDNPFIGHPTARPEIWAYGLRNPWRFSFDPPSNTLYIADPGQDHHEELNVQPAQRGGLNYGWDIMEGQRCYAPPDGCNTAGLTLPVLTYPHANGNLAIVGGSVYRGTDLPALVGHYIYGDYGSGRIWRTSAVSDWTPRQLLDTDLIISSFGTDEAGELYVLDYRNGTVYRLAQR